MTQLLDLSGAQLEKKLGRFISDLELVIAKNLALGVSEQQLCEILGNGITVEQIEEQKQEPSFQELYGVIAQHLLEINSESAIGWDQLEAISIRNLMREARVNRDPDFQLRLAAVANKAQRRHTREQPLLDANGGGTRVQISLNQRFIDKLNGKVEIRERTLQMDNIKNPTVESLQGILQMGAQGGVPDSQTVTVEATSSRVAPLPVARPQASISEETVDSALAAVMAAMNGARR